MWRSDIMVEGTVGKGVALGPFELLGQNTGGGEQQWDGMSWQPCIQGAHREVQTHLVELVCICVHPLHGWVAVGCGIPVAFMDECWSSLVRHNVLYLTES